jgi:Protein of unknown function (DUF2480)
MLENKVANKAIIQIDIEQWIPKDKDLNFLDLKEFLFKEMILKEAEFRTMVDEKDWTEFKDKYTLIFISNKAIIPQWAYLIIANKLKEVDSPCMMKTESYREQILCDLISQKDYSEYEGKRLLVKGCSREKLSQQPYILLAQKLTPIVRALSFGEACSTVPIFKN